MIQIVFKPEKAPVVKGEALYRAVFDQREDLFLVRAKNAAEAERKTMIVFRHELRGKLLDFNADDFPSYERKEDNGKDNGKGKEEEGSEAAEGGGTEDPAPPREEA